MSPTQAANIIKKNYPNLKVVSCKDYDDDYLVTAYETEEDLDPFYLVNKKTGNIVSYTIAEDPNKYYLSKELWR